MADQLFRKKSIDRVSSPEQLHDYMRVTSPKLWMILVTILVLLAGFIIFAASTKVENTLQIKASVEDGAILSELSTDQGERVRVGMTVRISDLDSTVTEIYQDKNSFLLLMELKDPDLELKDGSYDAEIVTETTTLISFLLN